MCGIAGIWNRGLDDLETVRVLLNAMEHRGPDGRGAIRFRGGAAGMVRLALVDLSSRGQQPMWSPDERVAIVFNGEVYNFREERDRLASRGYPFRSTTDTEVVLALFLEHGVDFVHRLRGMFALAILDWRKTEPGALPELLLVRDPLGIKPLYVAGSEDGAVVFASELRSLVAAGLAPARVDRAGLADYLTHGCVLAPRTIIEDVRLMEPGTLELYSPEGAPMRRRFWTLPPYEPTSRPLGEAADELRAVLEDSVRLHALADAPVGAFLSAGVDSSGVVALMRKHISHLHTFSLAFPDMAEFDESPAARELATSLACESTVVDADATTVRTLLPSFTAALDQPSTDGLNTWLVSNAASRDVKAVLSGLGGDEFFAGYPVVRRMTRLRNSAGGRFESLAGRVVARLGAESRHSKLRSLASRRSPLGAWTDSRAVFDRSTAHALVGLPPPEARDSTVAAVLDDAFPAWRQESPVGLAFLLDTHVYMGNQLLRDSDAMSMANSLELRVPLVDVEVLRFSRRCPDALKLRPAGGSGAQYADSGAKRVLIHALRDVLPPGMSARPKRGFALPYRRWLSGPLRPLLNEMSDPEVVRERGLLDAGVLRRLDLRPNGPSAYPQLWALMVLELWARQVLDSRPTRPLERQH